MGEYRRRLFMGTQFPKLALLVAALALYTSASSPWVTTNWRSALPVSAVYVAPRDAVAASLPEVLAEAEIVAAPVDEAVEPLSSVRFLAQGQASAGPLAGAERTNALIAMSLIDGYVIEPGARFSFDDVARTWDYREDPRYLWARATSRYGLVPMRGGGVCWVSTALWRAALWAGLPTEHRQSHQGLVQSLGIGTDATNTLVIRNDSDVPVTVRAWLDDEDVNVALLADERIDRVGRVRGPVRQGPGSYVLYQDVVWNDGTTTTAAFPSGYYW